MSWAGTVARFRSAPPWVHVVVVGVSEPHGGVVREALGDCDVEVRDVAVCPDPGVFAARAEDGEFREARLAGCTLVLWFEEGAAFDPELLQEIDVDLGNKAIVLVGDPDRLITYSDVFNARDLGVLDRVAPEAVGPLVKSMFRAPQNGGPPDAFCLPSVDSKNPGGWLRMVNHDHLVNTVSSSRGAFVEIGLWELLAVVDLLVNALRRALRVPTAAYPGMAFHPPEPAEVEAMKEGEDWVWRCLWSERQPVLIARGVQSWLGDEALDRLDLLHRAELFDSGAPPEHPANAIVITDHLDDLDVHVRNCARVVIANPEPLRTWHGWKRELQRNTLGVFPQHPTDGGAILTPFDIDSRLEAWRLLAEVPVVEAADRAVDGLWKSFLALEEAGLEDLAARAFPSVVAMQSWRAVFLPNDHEVVP